MMTAAEVIAPVYLRMVQGKYVSKNVAQSLLIGCSLSCILFITNNHFGSVVLVPYIILLIRVFVKSLYSLGYYVNGKLFPILVKTSVFSITNGIGRPFSALSTMVTEYTSHPGEIILVTSIICYFVAKLFPDSDNTEQEIEKLSPEHA